MSKRFDVLSVTECLINLSLGGEWLFVWDTNTVGMLMHSPHLSPGEMLWLGLWLYLLILADSRFVVLIHELRVRLLAYGLVVARSELNHSMIHVVVHAWRRLKVVQIAHGVVLLHLLL